MRMRDHVAGTLVVVGLAYALTSPLHAAMLDETKLLLPDPTEGDSFGTSVAVNGGVAVVGASGHDDPVSGGGAAYVFDVATGTMAHKLTAFGIASGDAFGVSVGVYDDVAIVGSTGDDPGGSAYLYDVTTGNLLHKLAPAELVGGDSFGRSVGIYGNVAIVGAYGRDDAGGNSGAAYLFDVTTGNQLHKLTALDAAAADNFGYAVAISGNTAVVGAPYDSDLGGASGSAYVFDVTTGNQVLKLTPIDGSGGALFGSAVAIDGTTVIVGAYGDRHAGVYSGAAYLFESELGTELHKLTADDAAIMDYFGTSVAVSGNVALVGAYWDDDVGLNSGSVYRFDVATGDQVEKVFPSDVAASDNFGCSVAASGFVGIAGALLHDVPAADVGSAYIFGTPEPATVALLVFGGLGIWVGRRRRD